ncbi:MAG: hypothetical protein AAB803_01870 [Patescibacteria group bacterium]
MAKVKLIPLSLFILITGVAVQQLYLKKEKTAVTQPTVAGIHLEHNSDLDEVFSETSPTGAEAIIQYKRIFHGKDDLAYRNYLANQYILAVRELNSHREYFLSINDYKSGQPHWLDNDYVFFSGGCGSSCSTLYLVNTKTKQVYQAVFSTLVLVQNTFQTTFADWFGKQHAFSGYVKHQRSAFIDGKAHLILEVWDDNTFVKEKKFRFTGTSLEEVDS